MHNCEVGKTRGKDQSTVALPIDNDNSIWNQVALTAVFVVEPNTGLSSFLAEEGAAVHDKLVDGNFQSAQDQYRQKYLGVVELLFGTWHGTWHSKLPGSAGSQGVKDLGSYSYFPHKDKDKSLGGGLGA